MPTYELVEIFTRIGLALAAGILVFFVPIFLSKARFAPKLAKRITYRALAFLALAGFCGYMWFLWNRHLPKKSKEPAPITYPAPPVSR